MRQLLFVVFCLLALGAPLNSAAQATEERPEAAAAEEQTFLDKIRSYLERDLKGDCSPGVAKTINNIENLSDLVWRPDELCRKMCEEENGAESVYQVGRYNYVGSSVKCCCELRARAKK